MRTMGAHLVRTICNPDADDYQQSPIKKHKKYYKVFF